MFDIFYFVCWLTYWLTWRVHFIHSTDSFFHVTHIHRFRFSANATVVIGIDIIVVVFCCCHCLLLPYITLLLYLWCIRRIFSKGFHFVRVNFAFLLSGWNVSIESINLNGHFWSSYMYVVRMSCSVMWKQEKRKHAKIDHWTWSLIWEKQKRGRNQPHFMIQSAIQVKL